MIETPAAAVTFDQMIEHLDFASIGTNDLTQYVLSAERGNPQLEEFADSLHPAVLRLCQQVIALAKALGRTPGSIAMKLNNFTSLDPDERSRGVSGLSGTSKLDKRVWDEFHQDWETLSIESELLWEEMVDGKPISVTPPIPSIEVGDEIDEAQRLVRVRLRASEKIGCVE